MFASSHIWEITEIQRLIYQRHHPILSSRCLNRLPKPCRHRLPAWVDLVEAPQTPSTRCRQVPPPRRPVVQTIRPWTCAPASTQTAMVIPLPVQELVVLWLCSPARWPLCAFKCQTALSQRRSSLLVQQRQCGRSGKASSSSSSRRSHRVMQSNILTLRVASKTCFRWVTSTTSLPSLSFLSALTIMVVLFSLTQDVLSMLDQPGTFNDDNFEMPMYSQFNEWRFLVCFAVRLSAFCFSTDGPTDRPTDGLTCPFLGFAWLRLRPLQLQVSTPLGFIYQATTGNGSAQQNWCVLLILLFPDATPLCLFPSHGSTWCQWWNKAVFFFRFVFF